MTDSGSVALLTEIECQSEQCEMPGHSKRDEAEGKTLVCPDCKQVVVRCFNCWAKGWTHCCTSCTGGRGIPAPRYEPLWRPNEDWDVDANGWLSNAIKCLEA